MGVGAGGSGGGGVAFGFGGSGVGGLGGSGVGGSGVGGLGGSGGGGGGAGDASGARGGSGGSRAGRAGAGASAVNTVAGATSDVRSLDGKLSIEAMLRSVGSDESRGSDVVRWRWGGSGGEPWKLQPRPVSKADGAGAGAGAFFDRAATNAATGESTGAGGLDIESDAGGGLGGGGVRGDAWARRPRRGGVASTRAVVVSMSSQ